MKKDKVTIEDFEAMLAIDEHQLEVALLSQPDVFYRVSKELARINSQRDEAKQHLAEVEARVDADLRNAAAAEGEKVREGSIAAEKLLNSNVKVAISELNGLNQSLGVWMALKEAFQQRSYMLKELVSLYLANYYSDTSRTSTQLRRPNAEVAKEKMNEVRRMASR